MPPVRICALLAVTALAGGCGGGSKQPATTSTASAQQQKKPVDPTAPPPSVPQKAIGPADGASVKVIEAWARTLRGGDVKAAARYFALPSRFQNATPVLTIDMPAERIAINEALPCGAVPTKLGSAGDFTIVTFRLVKRKGAQCGAAAGAEARSAIRVSGSQIREWYRLPDSPGDSGSNPDGSAPVV